MCLSSASARLATLACGRFRNRRSQVTSVCPPQLNTTTAYNCMARQSSRAKCQILKARTERLIFPSMTGLFGEKGQRAVAKAASARWTVMLRSHLVQSFEVHAKRGHVDRVVSRNDTLQYSAEHLPPQFRACELPIHSLAHTTIP